MKATLALHWKALVNKIHPPLSLTPRDSQKLLRLLNTSFRQRLDEHHPINEGHYAGEHVQSILNSPLFSNGHPLKEKTDLLTPIHGPVAPQTTGPMVNPMAVMKDTIAQGKANLETVKGCLLMQIQASAAAKDMSLSMKASGAGSITLHWLWTLGMTKTLSFLLDQEFTKVIVKFLVAEGRQATVRSWLTAVRSKMEAVKATNDPLRLQARLILELTKAEIVYGAGFSAALTSSIGLLQDAQGSGRTLTGARRIFSPSGNFLLNETRKRLAIGNVDLSDFETLQTSAKLWCLENGFEHAWLASYHPINPIAEPTLAYLRHLKPMQYHTMSKARRAGTIDIALRAAELYMSRNKRTDMATIIEVLRTHFPVEIGYEAPATQTPTITAEKRSKESVNVRLLETLAMG